MITSRATASWPRWQTDTMRRKLASNGCLTHQNIDHDPTHNRATEYQHVEAHFTLSYAVPNIEYRHRAAPETTPLWRLFLIKLSLLGRRQLACRSLAVYS